MTTLLKHIEDMNTVVKSVIPKDKACPKELEEQLRIFSECVRMFNIRSGAMLLTLRMRS